MGHKTKHLLVYTQHTFNIRSYYFTICTLMIKLYWEVIIKFITFSESVIG